MKRVISLKINGQDYEIIGRPNLTLLDAMRDSLELTGTKRGCDQGACGSCTVLVDQRPVLACLTLAVDVEGARISTIEDLSRNGELHPLQQAFIDHGAIQCGFCTPGVILSAKALLDANPRPSEEEIRIALSGNLCRCTGYAKIITAVRAAAEMMETAE